MNEVTTKRDVELLSYQGVYEITGVPVSTWQVWKCKGYLPSNLYVKLGTRVLFFKDRIISWLESGAPMQKPVKRIK